MKLDKRIIKGKKPLDCYDIEDAKKHIGKYCYFSNQLEDFADLNIFTDECAIDHDRHIGILKKVSDSLFRPFKMRDNEDYCGVVDFTYILPMEWLKQEEPKKYRAYKDAQEFFDDVGCTVGDTILFRRYDKTEYTILITGTSRDSKGTTRIGLGCMGFYSMEELYDIFEIWTDSNGWQKLGIIEE